MAIPDANNTYAIPAAAFNKFNLEIKTGAGTISQQNINNVEARQMLNTVYSFAQQKASMLRPLLRDSYTFNGSVMTYLRGGKADWVAKTESAGLTPITTMDYDKRAVFRTLLHAGHNIDIDQDNQASIDIPANFQLQLSYALGRNIDRLIQHAATASVVKLATSVDKDFQGAQTASTVALPSAQRIVKTTGAAVSGISTVSTLDNSVSTDTRKGEAFFDDIVEKIEEANVNLADVCIVGPPSLRRQIKNIDKFRNRDYSIVFAGNNENASMFNWLGLDFVIVNDSYLNKRLEFEDHKIAVNGDFDSSGTTLGADLSGANNKLQTAVLISKDALRYGECPSSMYVGSDVLSGNSYAMNLYLKVGLAIGRVDETKVWQILFKKN